MLGLPELLLGAIAIATVLESQLLTTPEPESQGGMAYSPVGSFFDWQDESHQLSDERDKEDHRDSRLGLGIKDVRRRLQQDETVFNIARPEHPLTAQP